MARPKPGERVRITTHRFERLGIKYGSIAKIGPYGRYELEGWGRTYIRKIVPQSHQRAFMFNKPRQEDVQGGYTVWETQCTDDDKVYLLMHTPSNPAEAYGYEPVICIFEDA